jgi:CBS domain-containing protein
MLRRLVLGLCAMSATGVLALSGLGTMAVVGTIAGVAGLTSSTTVAEAQSWRYRYYRHRHWRRYHYHSGDQLILIAESDVDLSLDRYTIDVRQAKGGYKGIRIKNAMGKLFDVRKVQIVYSDGSVWNEDRQIDMYWGERSRPINPTYDSKFIDQIKIEQVPGYGRGRLQIIGIQDREGREMDRGGGPVGRPEYRPDRLDRYDSSNGGISSRPTAPVASQVSPGQSTPGGDVLFGAQYVGFLTDRDVIRIGPEIGKFSKIRLRVLDNDIHIREMTVVYANGESDTLAINADIPKNSRTNWIDLRGDRFIKEIQLVYRSRPSFNGQARIEVFGRYAPGWLGPNGEGRKYNQGWVLLGAQTAGFIGFDKDIIPVGSNEGGFRRLRVTVRDRAITLNEIKVVYTDGQDETIPIRTRVDAGGTFGPIDLRSGRAHAIDHIEAKYRSRFFDSSARGKGSAIVEIWGQHY